MITKLQILFDMKSNHFQQSAIKKCACNAIDIDDLSIFVIQK
ncbi:hypothetical protein [Flavobacterium branchiophilum]|uniref:Uncharacterized protein n=1 Tax=Flavobacterium branchiophilum TaxID=55197 RepID=A0A543G7H0_9FLAO|nr:hypothetical protein [Flavobacterium branchiophilum]TQM42032.1 hypothetical protein BC670_3058 [Flavobacterium branchiophilum]